MNKPDYQVQLKLNKSVEHAAKAISNVKAWWAQEVDGAANKLGDQFTVHFGKTWGTFRVSEFSDKRIVWTVTDCYLDLLQNTKEWNGTRLIFQFDNANGQTVIDIMHEGLTPDKECFNDCTKGWNFYFCESLLGYLEKEQGLPGAGIHAWLESEGKKYQGKIYNRDQFSNEMTGDLLLLDVEQTKVEQVLSAYSVRVFNGEPGTLRGNYYMLLKNEPGLKEHLQSFVNSNRQ